MATTDSADSHTNASQSVRLPPLESNQSALGVKRDQSCKLTPLEKKARDRERKRAQARRRVQILQERDNAAALLRDKQHVSSQWHRQERQEEELVLRRLERDLVDGQKSHPATAGYAFGPLDGSAARVSPIFLGFSHALCPASQAIKVVVLAGQKAPLEATYRHPACHGYNMAGHCDASIITPAFFFSVFEKIPLESVTIATDDVDPSDSSSEERWPLKLNRQLRSEDGRFKSVLAARLNPSLTESCFICKGPPQTPGCPRCFEFSLQARYSIVSNKAQQRLKTPKTHTQEEDERRARHKALQRQLVVPLLLRMPPNRTDRSLNPILTSRFNKTEYYANVLTDQYAIQKHRTVRVSFVTLHIKSLPLGEIVSLRMDIKSTVAYVYELYRANIQDPNRPLHLLLPTVRGFFYLDEHIEDATDVRNGLVNGDFFVEDFGLVPSLSGGAGSNDRSPRPVSEFMLFSVAVLSSNATPRLIANYLQHNFHFQPHELPAGDQKAIQYVVCSLPSAVDQDLCQQRLRPHVCSMQLFAHSNKRVVKQEQLEERDRLVALEHEERKRAKLALKRKQNEASQQNGHRVSHRVLRALAYFQFVCDSTSHYAKNAMALATRLEKLWQCFQLFEEWKIIMAGRLIDAEKCHETLTLLQQHQEMTTAAFDELLDRKGVKGPLAYPVACVVEGRAVQSACLVLRIGIRVGLSAKENYDYGIVLNLEQDFDAMENAVPEDAKLKMRQRGFTRKSLALTVQEDDTKLSAARVSCADFEWRSKDLEADDGRRHRGPALLVTSTDLLRPPFYQYNWMRLAKAYKHSMRCAAFQSAKLEEFNALAGVLQNEAVVLTRAQREKWIREVEAFLVTLTESPSGFTALITATQRSLLKKGTALLKRRAMQRKQQLRDREAAFARLKQLQQAADLPKISFVQQMKLAFIQNEAPKIRAALELTPAEAMAAKAGQIVASVAAKVSSAAVAAKKEYRVRAL